ncbi:MAG: selenium-dependent molybdenum cofactor biosynthesis protein YqeB [Thermodesulfobacteriota bacterium]|nr:selenium-dependent molybdenum cofactor biosynthesis protein YqeB [Thermodesulfobacteriota bacterium]
MDKLTVVIKGGGEMASGVAFRLARSHFRICMTESPQPQAVRREVSFCEAVHDGEKTVEGMTAKLVRFSDQIKAIWDLGQIPIIVDPEAKIIDFLKPDVVVDSILAKRNLGTKITDAPLVIGLGPGFYAGRDVHLVVETNRGHDLGRVISEGEAEKNTGIPGVIGGYGAERVFRGPKAGRFRPLKDIGDYVESGDVVAMVDDLPVKAQIRGIIRGMLRDGTEVWKGIKAGDIDPRGIKESCYTISDKTMAIGGGVLEGILSRFNQ